MTTRHRGKDLLVGAGAGLAEATFWFVVPDVWTSWVAVHRPRNSRYAVVGALGGALVGGCTTHALARRLAPEDSARALALLPGIEPAMVDEVLERCQPPGHLPLVTGPTRGVPYKVFARSYGVLSRAAEGGGGRPDRGSGALLLWSVPARLPRFAVVTGAIGLLARRLQRPAPGAGPRTLSAVFVAGWSAFYAWYLPAITRRYR